MPTDRISGFNMGVSVKIAAQVASTGNLTLSGVRTVDGVSVGSAAERVLVKDQTTALQNGIYTADSSTWVRARDCDGNKDILPGSLVYVDRGTINNRSFWVFNSSSTATSVVVGTDTLSLSKVTGGLQAASSFIESNFFPATTAAAARTAIGAASTSLSSTLIDGLSPVRDGAVTSRLSGAGTFLAQPFISAKDYGCVGDNVTNDTVNMQTAMTAASSGVLYIPPGKYRLTSQLRSTSGGISIFGGGQGNTTLRWTSTATTRGVALFTSTASELITVRDLRLITDSSSSTYQGLVISATAQIVEVSTGVFDTMDRVQSRFVVENCTISGQSSDSFVTGWNTGLHAIATIGTIIRGCTFVGRFATATKGEANTFGILYEGSPPSTFENGHPVQQLVDACTLWFSDWGVYCANTEGMFINNCNIIACNHGITAFSSIGHPQTTITNSHANCNDIGVYLAGQSQSFVSNNLFYSINNSSAWIGVYVQSTFSAAGVIINGNQFAPLSTNGTCIFISSASDYISISNNIFQQGASTNYIITCISLSAGSSNCTGTGNQYKGTFSNQILNSGSTVTNLINKSSHPVPV